MSTPECREKCDVYKDWLKAGDTITRLETALNEIMSYTKLGIGSIGRIRGIAGKALSKYKGKK
jgi:hypothetical protein